jgi:hypothetical protein
MPVEALGHFGPLALLALEEEEPEIAVWAYCVATCSQTWPLMPDFA